MVSSAGEYTYANVGYEQSPESRGAEYTYSNTVAFNPISDSQPIWLQAVPTTSSGTKFAYIPVHAVSLGARPSYIVGTIEGTVEDHVGNLFINGSGHSEQAIRAFINGQLASTDSRNCFIQGAGAPVSSLKRAHISGPNPLTSFKRAFIQSPFGAFATTKAYVNAPAPQELGALRFTGTQRVTFADRLLFTGMQQLTVNIWVRFTTTTASTLALVDKYHAGQGRSFSLFQMSGSRIHYGVTTNNAWIGGNSTFTYTLNKWYMLTMTYNGANCALYVNGVFDSQFAKTGSITVDTGSISMAYRWDNNTYTTVDLADLTITDYAMGLPEIVSLYHGPFVRSSVGAYIAGVTPNLQSAQQHAYINSPTSSTNFLTLSDSQACVITGGIGIETQPCYIVASPVVGDVFDTQIVIDDFRGETFDLVIRFMVQGERARRFLDADVDYPITRQRYRDLPNIYYPDIPGSQFSNQTAYLHSGWFMDSHEGDLSGSTDVVPNRLFAYIGTPQTDQNYQTAFIQGNYVVKTGLKQCFIQGAPDGKQNAFISGRTTFTDASRQYAYINTVRQDVSDAQIAFVKGRGTLAASQSAMIVCGDMESAYKMAHISGPTVSNVKTQPQYMYIRSSILIVRHQNLYMNAHLFGFDEHIMCFIHAKPAISDSQSCYIKSAYPWFTESPQWALIMAKAPISGSNMCHISAERNIIDGTTAFVHGRVVRESSRRAFINAEPIVYNLSSTKRMFINAPTAIADSQMCFLNGGAMQGIQRAYIYNVGTRTKVQFAYVNGPAIISNKLAYVQGT